MRWVLVKEEDMEGSGERSLEKACLVGVEERIVLVEESGGRRERCIYINGEGESRGFPYLKHAQLVLSFVNL